MDYEGEIKMRNLNTMEWKTVPKNYNFRYELKYEYTLNLKCYLIKIIDNLSLIYNKK